VHIAVGVPAAATPIDNKRPRAVLSL
jgi:hypothetical protein